MNVRCQNKLTLDLQAINVKILGRPNTGKTTVAALFAAFLQEQGVTVEIIDNHPEEGNNYDPTLAADALAKLKANPGGCKVVIEELTLSGFINSDLVQSDTYRLTK